MKFSEQWLRTMVDPPLDTAGLADKLTMSGLEVEAVEPAAPPFDGVVVARIESVAPHPNADRLRLCTVDAGGRERLSVVCGAPNAAAGMKAPLALVGARLPGGLEIKRASVRGIESAGMLCSARELGISDDAAGLMPLSCDAPIGANLREALALDDALITLKITPNRADCLSLVGIARDVAAITGAPFTPPPAAPTTVTSSARRNVRVDDSQACPRFASRTIEGIDPKAPTPEWMKQRLERSGIRSISAVVDVTNYVMLELGQPLHAYDDLELDGEIVVRFARAGEQLTLLNGQTLDLEPDLLLVCDSAKPLGLAGIMGGEHSGIGDSTTTVFLEGAFWNPAVIQGKSRRLGFASDAGYRFERGVDFGGCATAVERATQLIVDICGGRAGPLGDVRGELPPRACVRLRPSRVARILGIEVAPATIASCLERLQVPFVRDGDDFAATPPSWRFDIVIEEDLIEEVARFVGYDAIPAAASAHVQRMLPDPEAKTTPSSLRQRLVDREYQEAITFSFVSAVEEAALFPNRDPEAAPIAVLNPIASHLDVMRTTLFGGLLDVLRTNVARKHDRLRVFELGRAFLRDGESFQQPLRIAGLAYGDAAGEQWGVNKRTVDFFDVERDVEALAAPRTVTTERSEHPALHPGRSATVRIADQTIGWIGELHPRLARRYELPKAPVLFELDLAPLMDRPLPVAQPVSKLPVARRDFAVLVDESLPWRDVEAALAHALPPQVDTVRLFDVYRGPELPTGKKSLAILVLIQDTERTLTDAEINGIVSALVEVLGQKCGAILRQ
jgi:phenylalanyl-tRNA synthetase beta chain